MSTHKFSYYYFFMQEAVLSSQLQIAEDINRVYPWWDFLFSVITAELQAQFKLLGGSNCLHQRKKKFQY